MRGGRARFVNHSCAPNCFAELVDGEVGSGSGGRGKESGAGGGDNRSQSKTSSPSLSPRPRVLIRAAVDLLPGEEITYDYCLSGEPESGGNGGSGGGTGAGGRSLEQGVGDSIVKCSCGAPACRGVL